MSKALKALFDAISEGKTALKCSSGPLVSLLCISRECRADACYCQDHRCTGCYGPHSLCECVQVHSLTLLLQKLSQKQQRFSEQLAAATERMIADLRRQMREL